jgi:hypothetical protein
MLAEKSRDQIPKTQEEFDAIIADINRNLGEGQDKPDAASRPRRPFWSDIVIVALVLAIVGSLALSFYPAMIRSRADFILLLGSAGMGGFGSLLAFRIADRYSGRHDDRMAR